MDIQRRGFLAGILAAGLAPAFVKAGSIMKINPPGIWVPPAPTLSATQVIPASFTVTWSDTAEPFSYRWQVTRNGDLLREGVSEVSTISVGGLEPAGTYQVWVSVENRQPPKSNLLYLKDPYHE